MSSSQPLGPWLIGERVGASVWAAEDTRNGKKVALKLLTRTLPKDSAKREQLVRDVRVAAALYHTFLVPILEIAVSGDNLVMIMEYVDAQTSARSLDDQPLDREHFFRFAYQLTSVVKYLHTKMLLHGNINGDAVLVTADGQVKLGGLNLANLVRREKTSSLYQQKGADANCVAYMAPEQIVSQSIDEHTDIFSTGVVLYEAATAKRPFPGATAVDVARAIVEAQPLSPRGVHPGIDAGVLSVLGACLFKDPFKRIKDMRALVEMIEHTDAAAVEFASHFEKKFTGTAASQAVEHRRSVLLIADVAPGGDSVDAKSAARMQQVLGESVYLFDGNVLDPFAKVLVAELPSVESALEAGRKGEFDLAPDQQGSEPLEVRLLLHAGEVELHDGAPAGASIEKAIGVLQQIPPNTLFITEDFLREGRGHVRFRDAGARAGVKLFTIVPPEPQQTAAAETELDMNTAELEAEAAAEQAALLAVETAKRRQRAIFAAIAAVVLLALIAGGAVMWKRRGTEVETAAPVAAKPAGPQPATAANPRRVYIAPFTVEGGDPKTAEAIQLGAVEILRTFPELRVVDTVTPDASSFSATVRAGAAGPEIVPTGGGKTGAAAAVLDVASGIRTMVQWVTTEVQAAPRTYAAASALNSFADAVVAQKQSDTPRADKALRDAMLADPSFLPAQLMAMQFFATSGRTEDALAAAKQVIALDPSNLLAARSVARSTLAAGDLQQSFAAYDLILRREPNDAEALNVIGRYAASAGDLPKFNATLARLKRIPVIQATVHEPDFLTESGRLDAAIQRYYVVEETIPNNAALALKIGRLAVLRHSLEIAEIERKKLMMSDPLYGLHMLNAYIAAENRRRDEALKELELALAASEPGDESWTSAAEVHAILNDTPAVLVALAKAVQRKEPSAGYVQASPLFRYLENDAKFRDVRQQFAAQQSEAKTALAQVR